MRKLFTLIFALMAVCSINAEETVLFESADGVALGWGGTKVDFSSVTATSGLTLHVTIQTTTGDWWQYKFSEAVENWPAIQLIGKEFVTANDVTYSWSAGTYTQDYELTEEQIARLKSGVFVQGSINNGSLLLKKVSVSSKINYQSPVTLEMDQWGQVLSKEFNGYSDDAKVTLTYDVTGAASYKNWGCGTVASLDGSVKYGDYAITVKNEGENTLSMTLGEIKDLLNAGPSQYGQYGVAFNTWGFGDGACTVTRKSVTIQEVEGFSGEGYLSPDMPQPIGAMDNSAGWWTAFSDYYTVKDGQKAHITFTNYSDKAEFFHNWVLVYNVAGTERGAADYAEYAVYRADNYGWGTYYSAPTSCNYNWTTLKDDMDGANVEMNLYNIDGIIYGTALITTTAGKSYQYCFNTANTGAKDFGFFLTVEKAHLSNVNVKITDASTIGFEDNKTPWWTSFSKYYTVEKGQQAHITFKNYSDKAQTWDNWMIIYNVADTKRGDSKYNEYACFRADTYGWGTNYDAAQVSNDFNWDTFKEDMNGADVAIDVKNVAGVIYSTATVTTTSGKEYTYTFNTTDTGAKNFGFFLSVENGHLANLDVDIAAIPKVSGDEVHAFYDWFLLCAQLLNEGDEFKTRDLGAEYQASAYPIVADYDAGNYKGKVQVAKDALGDAFMSLFVGTSAEPMAKMYVSQAKTGAATRIDNVETSASRAGKFVQNGRVVIVKDGKSYTTTGALLK